MCCFALYQIKGKEKNLLVDYALFASVKTESRMPVDAFLLFWIKRQKFRTHENLFLSASPGAHLHVVGMLRCMCFDINQPSLPTSFFFILFLCLFLSLWPFQLYFIPKKFLITLRFLTPFFRSYFCLIGPFNYIPLYESLSRSGYNPLGLTGLKAPTV